jgi:hypothetical protein
VYFVQLGGVCGAFLYREEVVRVFVRFSCAASAVALSNQVMLRRDCFISMV